jgi:predicted lipoprotein
MLAYDYAYFLLVILILAAIISGIIIDTFSELREQQQNIQEDMESLCFICSKNRSQVERVGVKFAYHIYQEHYMWSYARFLLHLEEADESDLTGPESRLKEMVKAQNFVFYPIGRAVSLESAESGESHMERAVRVKDMSELRNDLKKVLDDRDHRKQNALDSKASLDELFEDMEALNQRVQTVVDTMTSEGMIDEENLVVVKKG